jgi:hypothetical protein
LRSQLLLGDFNAGIGSDPWQVIPRDWIRLAQERWTQEPPDLPMQAMGVDVARGGADKTVIARRYGNWFAPLLTYQGKDTPDGNTAAAQVARHHEGEATVYIDVIGVGASVYDILHTQQMRNPKDASPVVGVNVADRSTAKDKSRKFGFVNKKAELWWKFREALDPDNGQDIALPPDSELVADLTSARWVLQTNGIAVESKEHIKKRIGRSPDKADALILASVTPRRVF